MNTYDKLREELTDDNYHTDAKMVTCLEMGRYDLIAELAKLAQAHEEQGHLTKEQQDYRDIEIDRRLLGGN